MLGTFDRKKVTDNKVLECSTDDKVVMLYSSYFALDITMAGSRLPALAEYCMFVSTVRFVRGY